MFPPHPHRQTTGRHPHKTQTACGNARAFAALSRLPIPSQQSASPHAERAAHSHTPVVATASMGRRSHHVPTLDLAARLIGPVLSNDLTCFVLSSLACAFTLQRTTNRLFIARLSIALRLTALTGLALVFVSIVFPSRMKHY